MEKGGVVGTTSGERIALTLQEKSLLEFFRNELKYGEARVIVKNGQPVNVWHALKNVKLD